MTKSNQTETIARHSFFSKIEQPTGILIPDSPVLLQANCMGKGSWILGEEILGNKPIEFLLAGFAMNQEFDPYKESMVNWVIIHFAPIACDFLKSNLVYTTKIKNMASNRKGSLFNLGNKLAELLATGLDPREVSWQMQFIPKSGSLPDGTPFNCSVVDFAYKAIAPEKLDPIIPVLEAQEQIARLTIGAMASESVGAIAPATEVPQLAEAK